MRQTSLSTLYAVLLQRRQRSTDGNILLARTTTPLAHKRRRPMDANLTPYALGSEDGEVLWFFGTLATLKATVEQTGGPYALIEQVAPQGVATPLHVQPEDHKPFYVLAGRLTFYVEGGRPVSATAGSFVHIPKGMPHAFQVDSETARFLDLTTPQHEYFMRATGEPAQGRVLPPAGPPDMEKVSAAAQEYGVEILGPPPGA